MSPIRSSLEEEIAVSKPPQRIFSLAPSNTEILFALGLDTEEEWVIVDFGNREEKVRLHDYGAI